VIQCNVCGASVEPRFPWQVRCGSRRCRKRGQYLRARERAGFREANAARCRAWYERNAERHKAHVAQRERPKEGAAGRWFVTPHAARQFRDRAGWQRADDYESALVELIDESRAAHFVKVLDSGLELWRGPKPRRLRYIVGPGEGNLPALVTVLRSHDKGQR
jgi:hypothetical protein